MRGVRTSQTDAERRVRHAIRTRRKVSLNSRKLPGSPDIVFERAKVAVFVHGCFWHGHTCGRGKLPLTRRLFWSEKIGKNVRRDRRVIRSLRALGYRVAIVWGCQLRDPERVSRRIALLLARSRDP